MDPTSLNRLIEESGVDRTPEGLIVTARPSWIVEGEDRLSYTTLIRLIECCREHHWNVDILPWAGDTPVDSVTRAISGEFISTISSGSVIQITYRVIKVSQKSYSLRFEVRDKVDLRLCATLEVVSVFYDALSDRSIHPPDPVFDHLLALAASSGS